jgi:hypothetical protein
MDSRLRREHPSYWTNMLGGMTQRSAGMTEAKAVTLDMYHCARITS